jgi:hypothetical protein
VEHVYAGDDVASSAAALELGFRVRVLALGIGQ